MNLATNTLKTTSIAKKAKLKQFEFELTCSLRFRLVGMVENDVSMKK